MLHGSQNNFNIGVVSAFLRNLKEGTDYMTCFWFLSLIALIQLHGSVNLSSTNSTDSSRATGSTATEKTKEPLTGGVIIQGNVSNASKPVRVPVGYFLNSAATLKHRNKENSRAAALSDHLTDVVLEEIFAERPKQKDTSSGAARIFEKVKEWILKKTGLANAILSFLTYENATISKAAENLFNKINETTFAPFDEFEKHGQELYNDLYYLITKYPLPSFAVALAISIIFFLITFACSRMRKMCKQ
ncbi:unnamed protein product [Soboliphyme baturini]|uniref:Exported protein n=1 Tax=Soboliphyme baturini TaxID=241478 RepID=A0A183J8Y0_9BILA|nr:unnamed protein product [Soboliphyme baturini]